MKKRFPNKICILGRESIGWSIDHDILHIENVLKNKGFILVRFAFQADIVYAAWWNALIKFRYRLIRIFFKRKLFIATITNDLAHQRAAVRKLLGFCDKIVYANTKQQKILIEEKFNQNILHYSPYYVDENRFKRLDLDRHQILALLNIREHILDGKKLIGSFQRDSLGGHLDKPKWQKNPDLILSIMDKLDPDEFALILAGPRRHYLINKLKEMKIRFYFIGDMKFIENRHDDLLANCLNHESIALLYNMIDIYLVSSSSEGGPKAVIEASLCKTPIISTDVGMASDLLDPFCIYKDSEDACEKINKLTVDDKFRRKIVSENFQNVTKINNLQSFTDRIVEIVNH